MNMRITDVRIGDTPRVHDNVDGTKMYEFRVFYKADGKPKDARGPRSESLKEAYRLAEKKAEAIKNSDDSLKVMDLFQVYAENNPTKKRIVRFLESQLSKELKVKSLCDLDYTFGQDFAGAIFNLDLSEENEWHLEWFKDIFVGMINEAVAESMISKNKFYEVYGSFYESYTSF